MKKFKNNFGIFCDNKHLLEAFMNEAKQAGWSLQNLVGTWQCLSLYFNAQQEDCSLKPSHNFFNATVYNLPEQWNEAIAAMKELQPIPVHPHIKQGDRFKNNYGDEYILAKTTNTGIGGTVMGFNMTLINLKTGNLFSNTVNCQDNNNITAEEWKQITGSTTRDSAEKFQKI